MTDLEDALRDSIAELTRSKGQTIDNDSRILVPVTISELTNLFVSQFLEALPERREIEISMASNLVEQEKRLYHIYSDENLICVGIKVMADQVREYFDGGIYTKD